MSRQTAQVSSDQPLSRTLVGSVQTRAPVLSNAQREATAGTIAETQLSNGMIAWFKGGHTDPWNHTEAAMALTAGGFIQEAEKAYEWLASTQLPNGAWHQYYLGEETKHGKTKVKIKDDKLDTNCVAYIAAGVWHHYLSTQDFGFLSAFWPAVAKAIDFVCDAQTNRGEVLWARHADGRAWPFALLTGSSSICHSLECALKLATEMGEERPRWQQAKRKLSLVISQMPEAFTPKERWAMDWYYPVLSGALTAEESRERLESGYEKFIIEGKGVRCVADKDWTTAAETAECAIAHHICGETDTAYELLSLTNQLRASDHRYYTGMVYPEKVHFPAEEKTTYTAAAVILANEIITTPNNSNNPTTQVFSPS